MSDPATITLEYHNPQSLKVYPLNIKLYGESIDAAFLESTKGGIRSPLTVCRSRLPELDGMIVKGRRRRYAAMEHRFKAVPCVMWECDDVLAFEEEMILDNVRNEITLEQRTRMYSELKRIEVEKGKIAQKNNLSAERPNLDARQNKGKNSVSREKAANSTGMKKTTAENAEKVVIAADEMRSNGHEKEADAVIETLNTKSVTAASRMIPATNGHHAPPKNAEILAVERLSAKLVRDLETVEKTRADLFNAIDVLKIASPAFANRHKKFETLMRRFSELIDPAANHAGVISTSWAATRKQIEE